MQGAWHRWPARSPPPRHLAQRCHAVTRDIGRWLEMRGPIDGVRLPTVSFGIASLDHAADLEPAMARADAALYRAKSLGRDQSIDFSAVHDGQDADNATQEQQGR